MNLLLEAAKEVCDFMAERRWQFCVIGGLAVQRWGRPRTTLDADFTLLTGWGDEAGYVADLLAHFESRVSGGNDFSLANRIVLIRTANGTEADIALGALPFEVAMMDRAKHEEFAPGIILPCCTPEDLFIMKAFAGRPRDWQDAEGIVQRQEWLDKDYILGHLEELCAIRDSSETLGRVRALLEEK